MRMQLLALWPCWSADLHSISVLMLDDEDVALVLRSMRMQLLALWPSWSADLHSISVPMLDDEDAASVFGGVMWFVLGLKLLPDAIGLM
ncbi:hypothetical protein Nepgr_003840 [Nepenthes gracilis]|uniref:Uncharacterized protein n=1 Tax=Nepenthes gracilis TaxID=150966 RepID=A0AAD3S0F3_NEPGR|nr:hypothetical protein Nepgr_003840 [Nepenthes gracilis]